MELEMEKKKELRGDSQRCRGSLRGKNGVKEELHLKLNHRR